MNTVVSAVLGAIVGLGAIVFGLGLLGVDLGPRRAPRVGPSRRPHDLTLRLSLAVAGGILAALVTRWPVAVPLLAAAAAAAPTLIGAKKRREEAVAKTEAIASWAEMLRDTMAAAAGLEEAILTSARVAPLPIRDEVRGLARRLERGSLDDALAWFVNEVEDPVADMVAASIVLTSRRQARRVGELLGAVASSARASAAMRLRVEAARARTYTSVRLVVGITVTFTLGLVVFSRDYLEPFDDAVGQGVLLAIGTVFGVAYWAMVKMADVAEPERLLGRIGELD